MNSQPSDVSTKNTKAEILRAYEDLRQQLSADKQMQLAPAQKEERKKEEKTILDKTTACKPDSLEQDVNNIKRKVSASLDGLLTDLSKESQVLQELRQAIEIERKNLEEVRNIQLADDALKLLIDEYDQKRSDSSEEIERKQKEREREEDEYQYNLKLKRRKEEDEYEQKRQQQKAKWEQEIRIREEELAKKEKEFNEQRAEFERLKAEVESYPKRQEQLIERVKMEVSQTLKKDFEIEKKLMEQDWSAKVQMLEIKTANLQETIKNQLVEIKSLKDALNQASAQSQKLAATVIESVSGGKYIKETANLSIKAKESAGE